MPRPDPEEIRRILAEARLRRHGWARFQDGNRRTAQRLARKPIDVPDTDRPA
jgi:hypothetical protein